MKRSRKYSWHDLWQGSVVNNPSRPSVDRVLSETEQLFSEATELIEQGKIDLTRERWVHRRLMNTGHKLMEAARQGLCIDGLILGALIELTLPRAVKSLAQMSYLLQGVKQLRRGLLEFCHSFRLKVAKKFSQARPLEFRHYFLENFHHP